MLTVTTLIPPSDSVKEPIVIHLDTDWFLHTNPAFVDTDRFLPEWEEPGQDGVAFAYFLEWYFGPEVVERNSHILCYDAKEALRELRTDPDWHDESLDQFY